MKKSLLASTFLLGILTSLTAQEAPQEDQPKLKPEPIKTIELGTVAPDFTLPGVDGKNHSLKDFSKSKVLVVVFTCNHCPDARAARDKISRLHDDYHDKGVDLVAISGNDDKALRLDELGYSVYGDSLEDMKKVAKEEHYPFPYLYDGKTQKTTKAYGAVATPHIFVFDAERKLRYTGRLDDARRSPKKVGTPYVRNAIEALLAGKEIAKTKTRPFGCSTKWSWKRDSVKKDNLHWESLGSTVADMHAGFGKLLAANKTKKLRIINFWSTSCGPCVAEMPDLVDTYRRYQNRSVELITISTDPVEDRAKVLDFLADKQVALAPSTAKSLGKEARPTNNYIYNGANLDNLAEAIDKEWNGALPYTIMIAPGGKIVWRHSGKVDPVELRRTIVRYLDSKDKKR